MTLTLDNRSRNKESSLTKALRQIQELNSKIQDIRAAASRLRAEEAEFD